MANRWEAYLRHAMYFADRLQDADALYQNGNESISQGLEVFDRERDNIEHARDWTEKTSSMSAVAAQLCSEFPRRGVNCIQLRLAPHVRRKWLEVALSAAQMLADVSAEASLRCQLGMALHEMGHIHDALNELIRGAQIAHDSSDTHAQLETLTNLGIVLDSAGQYGKAIECFQQASIIAVGLSDRWAQGSLFGNLGMAHIALGNHKEAFAFHKQHLAIAQEVGDLRGQSNALTNLGLLFRQSGDYVAAVEHHLAALSLSRTLRDRRAEAQDLGNLGLDYDAAGQLQQGIDLYRQRLAIAEELGDDRGQALALWNLGELLLQDAQAEMAVTMLQKAVDIEFRIDHPDRYQDAANLLKLRASLTQKY